jgi:MraZ protein
MLIGEYKHKIDDKKRISLPIKFRKSLGKKIIITKGLDGCLFIYSEKEWAKISEKIADLGMGQADRRSFNRYMLSGASEVELDSVGRILIPENLIKEADIKSNVIFAGVFNRIEVWDENRWEAYKLKVFKDVDSVAEKLGDIGAI